MAIRAGGALPTQLKLEEMGEGGRTDCSVQLTTYICRVEC